MPRHFRSGTRSRRTSVRRRRQPVTWLPTPKTEATGITLDLGGTLAFSPLEFTSNMFVSDGVNPRFAVAEDEVVYLRIMGQLRIAKYYSGDFSVTPSGADHVVSYGIALVPGSYDTSGVWTAETELPDPRQFKDDPDKWLYRNMAVLGGESQYAESIALGDGNSAITTFTTRPAMLSTDQQLPFGSWIDIKPKRKARYEEKIGIIYAIDAYEDPTDWSIIMNHNLRALIAKERT